MATREGGLDERLRALSDAGPPRVAVTLASEGVLGFAEGRFVRVAGFPVTPVDTNGAGDVFHGAFVYGLVRGWQMERLLNFANAMAALNCTALGARGGIAKETEAERLIAKGRRRVNREYLSKRRKR